MTTTIAGKIIIRRNYITRRAGCDGHFDDIVAMVAKAVNVPDESEFMIKIDERDYSAFFPGDFAVVSYGKPLVFSGPATAEHYIWQQQEDNEWVAGILQEAVHRFGTSYQPITPFVMAAADAEPPPPAPQRDEAAEEQEAAALYALLDKAAEAGHPGARWSKSAAARGERLALLAGRGGDPRLSGIPEVAREQLRQAGIPH